MNYRSIFHHLNSAYRGAASAVSVLVLTVAAAIPATAHADESPPTTATIVPSAHAPQLALPGFGAIVADDATRSVFLSSGPGADSVEEVGYDGTVMGTLGHEQGADGMALSADGSTLYVALTADDAVSAIDTATLTEKARYPLPPRSCPTNLARTGSDIWIGYGCDHRASAAGPGPGPGPGPGHGHGPGLSVSTSPSTTSTSTAHSGGVAVLATDAASPKVVLAQQDPAAAARYSAAPIVAASEQLPGTLVVSQPYVNPTTVTTYTASTGAHPSLRLVSGAILSGSELADLAVSPDGATAFAASGSQTTVDALSTSTLASSAQYTTGLGPDAVAVSPDGTKVASTTAIPGSHVYVWRLGDAGSSSPASPASSDPSSDVANDPSSVPKSDPSSRRPEGDYGRPGTGAPAPRGLAFSGDGRLLFFVTEPPSGQGGPTLTVLEVDED